MALIRLVVRNSVENDVLMNRVINPLVFCFLFACGQLKPSKRTTKHQPDNVAQLSKPSGATATSLSVVVKYPYEPASTRTVVHEDVKHIFDRDCKSCHFGAVLNFKEFPYSSPMMSFKDLIATSLQRMRRTDLKRMPTINQEKTPDRDIDLIQRWFDDGLKVSGDLAQKESPGEVFQLQAFMRLSPGEPWQPLVVENESIRSWRVQVEPGNDGLFDLLLTIVSSGSDEKKITLNRISVETMNIEIEWQS